MRQRIKFTDERVCKSHLLDSCPHDILSGTVSIIFIHISFYTESIIMYHTVREYKDGYFIGFVSIAAH